MSPARWVLLIFLTAAAIVPAGAMIACGKDARTTPPPDEGAAPAVRDVRVLLLRDAGRVRLRAEGNVHLFIDGQPEPASTFDAGEWIDVRASGGSIRVERSRLPAGFVRFRSESLPIEIERRSGGSFEPIGAYAGTLRFSADDDGLDLVNEVGVEDYVAGVVAGESWPTFHQESLRAQAIVSRTFVLYHMMRRADRSFDVSSSQGSQVYRGVRVDRFGQRARKAAEYTRGIVLTWSDPAARTSRANRRGDARRATPEGEPGTTSRLATDRLAVGGAPIPEDGGLVFCAYFSAACGGHTQTGAVFGDASDIGPLRGGIRCEFCKIAPGDTYRWGPVEMKLSALERRLVERLPEVRELGGLQSVRVSRRGEHGRATEIELTGLGGETLKVGAERFRLAAGPTRVKSSDYQFRQRGTRLIFSEGKGFGHGIGLCQWGMEGQARRGRLAGAILRYYFPGAKLTRVY